MSICTGIAVLIICVQGLVAQESDLLLDSGVPPHDAIDALYGQFSRAYRTLDADIVSHLYTSNAFYMTPGSAVGRGRAYIRDDFARSFASVKDKGENMEIRFQILDRQVSNHLATDVGVYTVTRKGKNGQRSDKGKFVVIALREKDGKWRFQTDIYNDIKE